MAAHMDKLSEAVWFAGRKDRTRKGADLARYKTNYSLIFGNKTLSDLGKISKKEERKP